MSYKLEMKHPEYPDGYEFDLGGVLIENGKSITLTESQELTLVQRHGASVKDSLNNNAFLKISGTSELSKKEVDVMTGGES